MKIDAPMPESINELNDSLSELADYNKFIHQEVKDIMKPHWIEFNSIYGKGIRCSNCGKVLLPAMDNMTRCPGCGIKLDY